MDLGDTPGKRCLHHAVATLRLGQGTGTVGFLQFGVGHGHFQVTDGIEFAQVALGVEVLPGHGQLGGRDLGAGQGFLAVELGQQGVFRHLLAEGSLECAEGAVHLAGQGGFQVGGEQHADRARVFEGAGRRYVVGQGRGEQNGKQKGEQTALSVVRHEVFLTC
ncbi:hypothetical protein D3C78_1110690 [compost metagenome]